MNLPTGWHTPSPREADLLLQELMRGLPKGHELEGIPLIVGARAEGTDDVLFCSLDGQGPVFLVHLTWQKETDPRWPSTRKYQSMAEFLKEYSAGTGG